MIHRTYLKNQLGDLSAPYVVMAVGIPGSGKTTTLKDVAAQLDIVYISPDEIRKKLTGSMADQSANNTVWDEAYRQAKLALAQNRSVIMDATHAEAWRRPEAIAQYRRSGAMTVIAVVFDTPLQTAKERNLERERVVPEHVLERMHKNLSKEPAAPSEGFDKVITIRG